MTTTTQDSPAPSSRRGTMRRIVGTRRTAGVVAMPPLLISLLVLSLGLIAGPALADNAQVVTGPDAAVSANGMTITASIAGSGDVGPAAALSARGSWNNWHVHDLPYSSEPYTDETGLRHEDYNIWPVIWPDYPSDEAPVVYCIDGAEKALVGGDGGSKLAAGTCRNDVYIIQIQLNDSDAPAPQGWTALPVGGGLTFYYRLTPR